jgi:hypothetical protein
MADADFTLVTCCDTCPFFAKAPVMSYCAHPKAFGKSIRIGNGTLPERCPLRDGPWTVRIKNA